MQITDIYTIGNLSLPSTWIAALLAIFITIIVLFIQFPKGVASLYADLAATFILVWKLSSIVTDFSTVIKQPLAILYFNGGTAGIILATAAVALQAWRKRNQIELVPFAWAIALTQGLFQIIMVLANDNARSFEIMTILIFSLLIILVLQRATVINLRNFAVLHIVVALVQPVALWQQTSWLLTMAFVIILLWQQKAKKEISL